VVGDHGLQVNRIAEIGLIGGKLAHLACLRQDRQLAGRRHYGMRRKQRC